MAEPAPGSDPALGLYTRERLCQLLSKMDAFELPKEMLTPEMTGGGHTLDRKFHESVEGLLRALETPHEFSKFLETEFMPEIAAIKIGDFTDSNDRNRQNMPIVVQACGGMERPDHQYYVRAREGDLEEQEFDFILAPTP